MKRIITGILLALVLFSCNEERQFNRKLDGEWNASQYFGSVPSEKNAYTFSFSREGKDHGNGYLAIDEGINRTTLGISYYTHNDELTMIIDENAYAFQIISFSRRKIELLDSYGQLTILDKN